VRADGKFSWDELRGTTIKQVEMPSTLEVLSFEMPPLPATDQPVLTGHRFSLRVKILGRQ
jgi:hypothetical protein